PPGRPDSDHRHGRDRGGARRPRVHDRRRGCRASRHGQLRRPADMAEAPRRHDVIHGASPDREDLRSRRDGRDRRRGVRSMTARLDQLLVALDVDTPADALALADRLRGVAGGFKVGNRLFTSHGPAFVSDLVSRGDRVFLDLKFHDIPHTVAGAVAAATRLGVWMVNAHASRAPDTLPAAGAAAGAEAARLARPAPLVIAVTMLTSLSQDSMATIGMTGALPAQVERLAALAQSAGLDGVVASPQEIGLIRARCGPAFS